MRAVPFTFGPRLQDWKLDPLNARRFPHGTDVRLADRRLMRVVSKRAIPFQRGHEARISAFTRRSDRKHPRNRPTPYADI